MIYCNKEMLISYDQEAKTNYKKTNELEVEYISNGVVHPLELSEKLTSEHDFFGGVTDDKLNLVELSILKRVSPPNFKVNFNTWYQGHNPRYDFSNIEYVDEDVIFLGAMPKHYGHFILEGLSRLWFCLGHHEIKLKCVYISTDGEDRFNDLFKLFGLKEEQIIKIEKPTRFKTVIVPEQSIRLHDFYHKKYKETIDKIKENVKPIDIEKVYFSKKRIKNNRAFGEALIEGVFLENDFRVYYPETLSMYDMIAILKGCKVFAATSATNAHNSIFMNDQNEVICLNRSGHFHPVQTMIERMRRLKSIYIDIFYFSSIQNFGDAPCLLYPSKNLLSFLTANNFKFNKTKLFLKFPLYLCGFIIIIWPKQFIFKKIYSRYLIIKPNKNIKILVKIIKKLKLI